MLTPASSVVACRGETNRRWCGGCAKKHGGVKNPGMAAGARRQTRERPAEWVEIPPELLGFGTTAGPMPSVEREGSRGSKRRSVQRTQTYAEEELERASREKVEKQIRKEEAERKTQTAKVSFLDHAARVRRARREATELARAEMEARLPPSLPPPESEPVLAPDPVAAAPKRPKPKPLPKPDFGKEMVGRNVLVFWPADHCWCARIAAFPWPFTACIAFP